MADDDEPPPLVSSGDEAEGVDDRERYDNDHDDEEEEEEEEEDSEAEAEADHWRTAALQGTLSPEFVQLLVAKTLEAKATGLSGQGHDAQAKFMASLLSEGSMEGLMPREQASLKQVAQEVGARESRSHGPHDDMHARASRAGGRMVPVVGKLHGACQGRMRGWAFQSHGVPVARSPGHGAQVREHRSGSTGQGAQVREHREHSPEPGAQVACPVPVACHATRCGGDPSWRPTTSPSWRPRRLRWAQGRAVPGLRRPDEDPAPRDGPLPPEVAWAGASRGWHPDPVTWLWHPQCGPHHGACSWPLLPHRTRACSQVPAALAGLCTRDEWRATGRP
jgi:hypothetical protein